MTVKTIDEHKPWEMIEAQGRYYVIVQDKETERVFNNLPPEDEEGGSQIIIPEHLIEKQQQEGANKGMEYVWRIASVGPDCDMVTTEQGGLKKTEPLAKVGDIVLCKGTCPEIYTNPRFRICTRENIVGVFKNGAKTKSTIIT